MTRTLVILAAALCIASPALAGAETDYPHREWGQVLMLNMDLIDGTACIARTLDRKGDAIVIPATGGNDIDFAPRPAWGSKMEPWLSFKLREVDNTLELRVFYRHPMRQGTVTKFVKRLEEGCLKVTNLAPATEPRSPNQ